MKTIITFILITVFAFAKAHSQELSGIATYQSQRSVDIDFGDEMGDAMKKQLMEQMKKQFQKTYTLEFDGSESVYTEDEAGVAPPSPSSGGVSIVISGNSDITYNNVKDERYVRQSDLMGKTFLIQDTLPKIEWKLEKEVKNIGQYTCFKATFTEEYEERSLSDMVGDDKEKVTKKTRTTTAWYTLDIPVKHGPDRYWGLPGLVLEVGDGKFSLMCTKVVVNPKDGVTIEIPSKGKKVSDEEYEIIAKEKADEMMERYSGGRKKGDGSSFSIKIGG